jgi:hypothetical protein
MDCGATFNFASLARPESERNENYLVGKSCEPGVADERMLARIPQTNQIHCRTIKESD